MAGPCDCGRSATQATTICAAHAAHRRQLRRLGALTGPAHHIHQSRGPAGPDEHTQREGGVSMPTYNTPTPIDLAINLQVGAIEVIAGDRADTVVTVSPTNPTKTVDRRGAEETKVDFDGQRVTIMGPRPRLSWIGPGPFDSVDIKVELPSGSRLTAESAVGGEPWPGRQLDLHVDRVKRAWAD